jgi:hypothetical protein
MFRDRFTMNDPCPVCGLVFQREEGYFLGAMYVSYVLSSVVVLPLFLLVEWLFPSWPLVAIFFLTFFLYLPLVPAVFRYSRVIWIYFERAGSSGDVSAGPYEKLKMRERDEAREQGK